MLSYQKRLDQMCQDLKSGKRIATIKKAADPLLTTSMTSQALKRQLADHFINQVVNESVLLSAVTLKRVNAPSGDLTKLRISGHITEKATENTDSGNTMRPSNASLTYTTVKSRSAMDISGEWQEDNVEGPSGKQTVVTAMVDQISNDMEVLGLEGDSSTVGSDSLSNLLKINDGWNVLASAANGAHIVNAGAKRFSYALSSAMLRNMPTKWKRNKKVLRWIVSTNAKQDYIDEQAARVTPYGDVIRADGELPLIQGIAALEVPLLPEDLSLTGTNGTTGTFIFLTDPKNLYYIVQRDLRIDWWRNNRKDTDEATIYMRSDFLIEETDALVKASNVSVWTSHSYYS